MFYEPTDLRRCFCLFFIHLSQHFATIRANPANLKIYWPPHTCAGPAHPIPYYFSVPPRYIAP